VVLDWMDIIELGYELTNPVKQTRDGRRSARIPHDVGKLALKKLQSTETALRPLDGFCTMPLLLDDGTINAAHGYHEPTRLYCHRLQDITVLSVQPGPTLKQHCSSCAARFERCRLPTPS
jgi:hypothetical protein